jgi:hypothetical protein
MKTVSLSDIGGEFSVLDCPLCGESLLHQRDVTVFTRAHEDGPVTRSSIPSNGDLPFDCVRGNPAPDNPSDRRQGLRIAFECEQCADKLSLCIAQRKGETLIWWDLPDA